MMGDPLGLTGLYRPTASTSPALIMRAPYAVAHPVRLECMSSERRVRTLSEWSNERSILSAAVVVEPFAGLELDSLLVAHKTVCAIDGWEATLRRYQAAVAICACGGTYHVLAGFLAAKPRHANYATATYHS